MRSLTTDELVEIYYKRSKEGLVWSSIATDLGVGLQTVAAAYKVLELYLNNNLLHPKQSYARAIRQIREEKIKKTMPEKLPEPSLADSYQVLDEAFVIFKQAVAQFIASQTRQQVPSLSEEIKTKIALPNPPEEVIQAQEVDDNGVKGYLFDELFPTKGEKYTRFIKWFGEKEKTGGVLDDKFYVKKEDWQEYLAEQNR